MTEEGKFYLIAIIAMVAMLALLILYAYAVAHYVAERLNEVEATRAPRLCAEIEDNAFLKFEGFKAKYKVYVNGSLVWSGLDAYSWAVKTMLRGYVAEVKTVDGRNTTLYVIRLPNGTYALVYGNALTKRLCIS